VRKCFWMVEIFGDLLGGVRFKIFSVRWARMRESLVARGSGMDGVWLGRGIVGWLCVCLACLVGDVAQAGDMPTYGPWHSSRFGGGGYVLRVVVSPSDVNRVYAHVDVGGLYRSDDGGASWRMLHGNLPAHRGNYSVRSMWVDPTDPDCLLIATGDRWDGKQGIYRSTDGGTTWEKTFTAWFWGNGPRRAAGNVLVGDPVDVNRVYLAAMNDGFAISDDKGKTWRDTGNLKGLAPTDIWVDPLVPQRIWVACSDQTIEFEGKTTHFRQGLSFSTNGGLTFELISGREFSELAQLPWGDRPLIGIAGQAHVLASDDLGATWRSSEDGLPIDEAAVAKDPSTSPSAFNAVAVGPDFALIGTRHGEIYRLDGGQTAWRYVEPRAVREGDWWGRMAPGTWRRYGKAMSSITVSPGDPDQWFTTDWYGVYRSRDAGTTWDLSLDGIEATVIHAIAADPTVPTVIHVGMADNGYVRSEDWGVRFKKLGAGPSNVKQIVASTAQAGLLYEVGSKGHTWLANQLYRSINGGESWSPCQMEGLPDMNAHQCNSLALDPADPMRLWLAVSGTIAPGEGGVYVSRDGGENFTWDSHGMSGASFFATSIWQAGPELAVGNDGSMIAISATGRVVYTRSAGKREWCNIAIDLPSYGRPNAVAASVHSSGVMAVAIRGMGIYLSSDKGQTFDRVWSGDASYVTLGPMVPDRIAASTNQGVVLSTDHGRSFVYLDQSLPDRVSRLPLAFAGNRLIVGTAGSGIFYIDLPGHQ
jgi:photosystem II stability/assembly factor-like uncharacterized protein